MVLLLRSDLKGANVLIKSAKATVEDPRGYLCKLADFGLARVLGSNRTHVSTSTHGTHSPSLPWNPTFVDVHMPIGSQWIHVASTTHGLLTPLCPRLLYRHIPNFALVHQGRAIGISMSTGN